MTDQRQFAKVVALVELDLDLLQSLDLGLATGTTHDIVASEDHVISLVNATATRGGKTFHYRTAEI